MNKLPLAIYMLGWFIAFESGLWRIKYFHDVSINDYMMGSIVFLSFGVYYFKPRDNK